MRHPARFGALVAAAACAAGCGPTKEPTRFIPAPAVAPDPIAPATAGGAAAPPRPVPPRNIEMH